MVGQNISQINAKLIFKKTLPLWLEAQSTCLNYMTELYDCQQLCLKEVNSSHLYHKLFHFEAKDNASLFSQIPVRTHPCNVNNIKKILTRSNYILIKP